MIIPHCLSAETVFLNLGGTTDFIRPKRFAWGFFFCLNVKFVLAEDATMQTKIDLKKLRLRPYKKCDAKFIVKWSKDEVAFRK